MWGTCKIVNFLKRADFACMTAIDDKRIYINLPKVALDAADYW